MFFLKSFVHIKDGKEEKVAYVKEDNFVAIIRANTEEGDLVAFLYSIVEDLRDDLTLFDFDELVSAKVRKLNLPPTLDLACGHLHNSKFYIKTINKGAIFGERGKERALIISGNKSAVGNVKQGDRFIFSFQEASEDLFEEVEIKDGGDTTQLLEELEIETPFVLSSVEEFEEEGKGSVSFYNAVKLPDRKKFQFVAVGVVILFLLGSAFLGYKKKQEAAFKSKYMKTKEVIIELLNKAEESSILSPSQAEEYLSKAEEKVAEFKENLPNSKKPFALELERLVEDKKREIFKEIRKSPEEFFDLSLLKKGAKGREVAYSDGRILILTQDNNLFYLVLDTKKSGEYNLSGIKDLIGISFYNKKAYVLSKEGIYEVFEEKTPESIIQESDAWSRIIDFQVYGNNFYILDIGKNQVLKYTPVEGGYSDAIEYLKPPLPELNANSSMVIDGAIYMTAEDTLYKYFQGRKVRFVIKIPSKDLKIYRAFTTKDLDLIYILDKNAQRIFVVDKESGELKEQIQAKAISKAVDFFVHKSTIYLLIGGKIYILK